MSDSLWPHGLYQTRLPCPLLSPGVCSNSCLLCQWCHPTISSSVVPFSSCFQSFPASGSFPMSLHFASGGQSIEASASASVLPMNIQDWFPLGLTNQSMGCNGLLAVQGTWTVLLKWIFTTDSDKKKDQEKLLLAQQEGKLSEKAQEVSRQKNPQYVYAFFKLLVLS